MDVKQIIKEQDHQLEDIMDITKRLRKNAQLINNELDTQNTYILIIIKALLKQQIKKWIKQQKNKTSQ